MGALKVLSAALARDSRYMARFQRQAQVLASLNHPHIARLHGLEESGGVRALVMELVEGPTLADRMALHQRTAGQPGSLSAQLPGVLCQECDYAAGDSAQR
jgi:serine/threonine protein kinase